MSLFLLTYLTIYGGSHLYCLLRIKSSLKLKTNTTLPLGAFMLAMVVAPVAVRLTEKAGYERTAMIFSFSIITWLYFPIHWGCLNPVDHCYLYVSRGSGTWGPPIRFLSPPEVTLIEIISEND